MSQGRENADRVGQSRPRHGQIGASRDAKLQTSDVEQGERRGWGKRGITPLSYDNEGLGMSDRHSENREG